MYGTKGKIRAGVFYKENGPGEITVTPHFGGKTRVVELEELAGGYQGHGGGDWGLIEALYDDMLTVPSPEDMTTSIEGIRPFPCDGLCHGTRPAERAGGGCC